MNIVKLWQATRGYKRQAGALMALVPMLLQIIDGVFGLQLLNDANVSNTLKTLECVGTFVWGAGWVDKGAVTIKDTIAAKDTPKA
jgi:hypothetical protein